MAISNTFKIAAACCFIVALYWSSRSFNPTAKARQRLEVSINHDKETVCLESHKFPKIERIAYPRASPLVNFLEGPGLDFWHDESIRSATCKFRRIIRDVNHFPHAMQQVYRCFSWWLNNPNKEGYFLTPPTDSASPFMKGFLTMLQELFDIRFINDREGRASVRPRVDYGFDALEKAGGFKMRSPHDFDIMRQKIDERYPDWPKAGCPPIEQQRASQPPLPQLTILNRSPATHRHLWNAVAMKEILEYELTIEVKLVDSFDQATFVEQVQTMQETDILLSPHGAQWISIPFLPSCASTFEFFPAHYFTPKFYGSLACMSGHVYHAVSNENAELWHDTLEQREQARSQDICLTTDAIYELLVPAVNQSIVEWRRCCGHHHVTTP